MPDFYFYFISSLPMLHFSSKPPFSLQKFLDTAGRMIPKKDILVLESLPLPADYASVKTARKIIKDWVEFDTALRNEIVLIRASRMRKDPAGYLRGSHDVNNALAAIVLSAHRNYHLHESEQSLDQERWIFLDQLASGHYFDLDFLIVYAYKLMILLRWQQVAVSDARVLLENAVSFA